MDIFRILGDRKRDLLFRGRVFRRFSFGDRLGSRGWFGCRRARWLRHFRSLHDWIPFATRHWTPGHRKRNRILHFSVQILRRSLLRLHLPLSNRWRRTNLCHQSEYFYLRRQPTGYLLSVVILLLLLLVLVVAMKKLEFRMFAIFLHSIINVACDLDHSVY